MIESCNKKRMLIGVLFLGGLTLIVLFIESHWASDSSHNLSGNKSNECWTFEKFEILKPCHPCSNFEIASKSVEACFTTKYKEILNCETAGKVQRSCERVDWIEERHYWIFEGCMFALTIISYSAVYLRQRILERRAKSRIQKQLANGLAH